MNGSIQFVLKYNEIQQILFVNVVSILNLLDEERKNLCDPFVTLQMVPQDTENLKRITKIMHETIQPVFNTTFHFKGSQENLKTKCLEFLVSDFNIQQPHIILGRVLFPLDVYGFTEKLSLNWKQLKPCSQVHIAYS